MSNSILVNDDMVNFMPTFGAALVVVQPGKLVGSGPGKIGGKNICVVGDEDSVSVPNCVYVTPMYSIPGQGTLKVAALASDQKAAVCKTGGKAVLLEGARFTAKFEVTTPAKFQPPAPLGPISDPTPQYSGQGRFVAANAAAHAG